MLRLLLAVSVVAALPLSAHSMEFMKCNTMGGKTLWASFGKKMRSGDPAPTYFPVDLTLFRSPTELQDRILFNSSKDAAGIPLEVTTATIHFAFPAKGLDGQPEWQALRLRLYSPGRSATAYIGEWATGKDQLQTKEQAFCSVY
jgi:hypothetical protein